MPTFFTNRSIPVLFYLKENEDDSLEYICSSKGTGAVVKSQAAIIGKNVIGSNIISYTKLVETEGGCDWVSVLCVDIGGSIPEALKKLSAEAQLRS